jgi:hypothetical protein
MSALAIGLEVTYRAGQSPHIQEGGARVDLSVPCDRAICDPSIDTTVAQLKRLGALKLSVWCPHCQTGHTIAAGDAHIEPAAALRKLSGGGLGERRITYVALHDGARNRAMQARMFAWRCRSTGGAALRILPPTMMRAPTSAIH